MKHDLNDMMTFLAVVESGSFTAAAERLNMPKANVSRKVSRLEQQLGVTLLERSTRAQHLTEAGRNYLYHCKRIHEEMDLAEAAVGEILNAYKGSLRVGTSVTIGQHVLKPVLAEFIKQYPELELQLSIVNRRVDLIEEGFDVLIRVGELDDSRLIARPLAKVSRHFYANPEYLARSAQLQTMEDLNDHPILAMDRKSYVGKVGFTNRDDHHALEIRPKFRVDDFQILKQMIVDGAGVGVLPDYMAEPELSEQKLIKVLPEWCMEDVQICALFPKHRAKIPKVAAFLEFVGQRFSELQLSR